MTFDALLVASYGGPRGPEDVLPFMRNATRGRGIPDERLVEVSGHYQRFGGISPINERNAELMAALGDALAERGVTLPIVIGNRNWTPYVHETLAALAEAGAQRVLVLATAGYASYSGCRQYREDLAAGLDTAGLATAGVELDLVKIGPFAETDGFVTANADAVRDALAQAPGSRVVFVSHSIPTAMDAASGPGEGQTYAEQHARVAARIAAEVGLDAGDWELAWCSRSGAPHIPWLEPDIDDRLEELAGEGVISVITVPYGFVNDHMEVVYDLDTQARETAERLGLGYVRAATAGVHPAFVGMLADAVAASVGASEASFDPAADPVRSTLGGLRTCTTTCCGSGRPGGPTLPAACGAPE
ncbi:MAG: ferrochelatase [Propionibacteriaceae bacterium]|nr:ferrochelatase [Propionibacteriaceae bacterium]